MSGSRQRKRGKRPPPVKLPPLDIPPPPPRKAAPALPAATPKVVPKRPNRRRV